MYILPGVTLSELTFEERPPEVIYARSEDVDLVVSDFTVHLTFSEVVHFEEDAFSLTCADTPIALSFYYSTSPDYEVSLRPDELLPKNANCALTAYAAHITDLDATAMLEDFTFNFISPGPELVATSPTEAETQVPVNPNILFNFNEPVNFSEESFTLSCAGVPVPFTISHSPATAAVLTPNTDLPRRTGCTATVIPENITDTSSIPPVALRESHPFTFSTGHFRRFITTQRASLRSDGSQENFSATSPSLSADGRYVAFVWGGIIHVRDLVAGTTTAVPSGAGAEPVLSADGRYVAFRQSISGRWQIVLHDLTTGSRSTVSVSSAGVVGNNDSLAAALSADGRYIAFSSRASNLVSGDSNGKQDVFVRDHLTGQTTRVSVSSVGAEGNADSFTPTISADGRFVAFASWSNNLVPNDTNARADIFVHDRLTGQTTHVSITSNGTQADQSSYNAVISADGRYVAFTSYATNLVPYDTNNQSDIFVHDRLTGQTTRVSITSNGTQANADSSGIAISADGRYVAFASYATNLVSGFVWAHPIKVNIFVHDRLTGKTIMLSVSSDGFQGDKSSQNYKLSMSADGQRVAFHSDATNLVSGDTNGVSDVFVTDITYQAVAVAPDTIGIFRPSAATFHLRNSNTTGFADLSVLFGDPSDLPVAGDWNGDGISTIGVYRQSTGVFYLKDENTFDAPVVYSFVLGNPGDVPLVGDWNGDGKDSVGVFRPSNGILYLKNSLTTGFAEYGMVFGNPNDKPVAGDWDGDGTDSIGIYRGDTFYLTNQTCNACIPTADYVFVLGNVGDVPFAGDWNADGSSGVGVFRPTNGITYFKNALTTGFADLEIVYGVANDAPIAGVWQIATPEPSTAPELAPTFVPRQ